MACIHINIEEQKIGIGFHVAQFCHPFCGFEILHLGIVKARCDQHVRVGLLPYLVIWGIRFHVFVVLLVVRVAPFIVFAGRQGNRIVEHGGDDVDEGHRRYNAVVEFGAMLTTAPINSPPAEPPMAYR